MSSKWKVMWSAVFCDILHDLTLTASMNQFEDLEADELEWITVRPAGAIIISAGLGGSIHAGMIDSIALGTDILVVIVVTLILGAIAWCPAHQGGDTQCI